MALTREELAQQTLDSARQAVEDMRNLIFPFERNMLVALKHIDEAITGLSDFLPLPNAPLPIPPVEVPSDG